MPSAARFDGIFWSGVIAEAPRQVVMGTLHRMVENQEQKVTVSLVDDLDEHDMLETILEQSKPPLRPGIEKVDYLLRAPWRYPPLRWGSRFGNRFEPAIFYGSLDDEALFAEAAYYRLLFVEGMERPFKDRVISQHTRFEARFRSAAGLVLAQPPFARFEHELRHRSHYGACHTLGTALRETEVTAFTYLSARTEGRHENVALLDPSALRSRTHRNPVHGLCETRKDGVQFRFGERLRWLARDQFEVEGVLPQPAA